MIEHADRIRQRAYEIWQAEGQPHGRDLEHWCRAEAEAIQTRPNVKKTVVKKPVRARAQAKAS